MEEVISFLTVLIVAVVIAGGIGTMYATGLRLWARSTQQKQEGPRLHGVSYCIGCLLCGLRCCSALCALAYDSSVPLSAKKG